MASDNIRDFNFYSKFKWRGADFNDLQEWLKDRMEGMAEGAFGASVLTGLEVDTSLSGASGMQVTVSAGIAVNEDGRLLVLTDDTVVEFDSPVGNPARSSVVLRPVDTDATLIQNPTDPFGPQVYLHVIRSAELVVLDGTPSVTPSYPTPNAGDVVVMGVRLAAAHSDIVDADLDRSQRQMQRPRRKKVNRFIVADYVATDEDEIIEVDSSAGVVEVTLPPAADNAGRELVITKVDSSAFEVEVFSSDLISGQATQVIDSQWGSARVYSNGISWRIA